MSGDRFDHLFVQPSSFDASLAFYRDALGWKVEYSWGGKGEPRGACLASAAISIVLAEPHPAADRSKSHGINGTRPTLHLQVENLDERYRALAGVALFAPERTHWGTRWFVARDPDGNLIAFEQKDAVQPQAMEALTWAVHDHVPPEAGRIVDDGLGQSNETAAPVHELARLSCFMHIASGAIVGGAVGRRWGECCELQQLWVEAAYRRRGFGTKLVKLFETRAAERGCRTFYLDTFSFQAPVFYRKLGYQPAAEIRGFPGGIVKYVMLRHG